MRTAATLNVLHLHTLGGLSISANGALLTGAVARRRSLALLSLVAAAGEAGVSDEHALALLWPDFDAPRARNNLKQVVFTLRHALAKEAFLRTPTTLRLDPELFSVDRWDFERAIAERNAVRAVELYTGPFLAGFHISGLADFDRWVEGERERLAHLFADALRTVASNAEAAGDLDGAITLWRRLVSDDPLNDLHAERLIRALALSGDSSGALQHARVHESLVAQELDTRPSPAFQRLVQDLRAGAPLSNGAPPRSNGTTIPGVRLNTPARAVAAVGTAPGAQVEAPLPTASPVRDSVTNSAPTLAPARRTTPVEPRLTRLRNAWTTRERRVAGFTTRFTSAAVILIVVGTLAAITVARYGPRFVSADVGSSSVVVVPFSGNGPGNAGAIVAELLAASLDGSLGLRTLSVGASDKPADPLTIQTGDARRAAAQRLAVKFGAGYYVSGDVFEIGDRVRITAEFRSTQDESILDRAVAEGTQGDLFGMVDRIASQLLAGRIAGGRRDVVRVASVTTSSLQAAKAYFRGEASLAEGNFRAAIDAYEEAVQLDSAFALAHYGLANAAEMLGDDELVSRAAGEALQDGDRLPNRQKRLLAAFVARHQGDVTDARRLYGELTADYPADAEAWLGLGETLFHLNPLDGRPSVAARNAFARAIQADSTSASAWVHLARIAALEGNGPLSRRMVTRALALASEPAVARFALHTLSLGVPLEAATRDRAGRRNPAGGTSTTDAIALLSDASTDALRRYARRLASGEARAYGLRLQSMVEAGQGRISEALALLDTCRATDPNLAVEARSRLAAIGFIPFDPEELDRIRGEVSTWTREQHSVAAPADSAASSAAHPHLRLHRLGLISLRLNDTATALGIARQLEERSKDARVNGMHRVLAASLRAHLAASQGRTREALTLLDGASDARVTSVWSLEAYDRLLRAQLLEQASRDEEALGFYAQLGDRSAFELPLVWQAELGMARIHARRGNPAVAARYYRSVATRLKDADSTFWRIRDEAEQQADSLLPFDRRRGF